MKKWLAFLFILAFALSLRFWQLGIVPKIYFDEIHYIYDAMKYQAGVLPFDRGSPSVPKHPLLCPYFIQLGISLFGFNYLGWRFFSAVFGALSVAVLFLLTEKLFNLRTALIAAFLLSIDFLHLVLSRMAMTDIYLLFFLLAGFYFFALSVKNENSKGILLAGTFFGLSLAIKLSALLSIFGALLIYILDGRDPRKGLGYLLVYPLFLFLLVSLFLNLSAGMNIVSWAQFEIGNLINQQHFSYIHPSRAPAWTWPFLLRSTPFYVAEAGTDGIRAVIAFGNPAVYWIMLPVMLRLLLSYIKGRNFSLLFVLIGFFSSFLPWIIYDLPFIHGTRLFFYYFLPSVPFYLMGLSFLLDKILSSRNGKITVAVYLLAVTALFIFFSPLLYGFPVSLKHFHELIWLKGWWM